MMILRWFKYLPLLVAIFVVSNVIACSGSGDSYPSPVSYASAIGNWEANAEGIKWLADPFKTGKLSVQELNCCEIQTIDGQGGAFVASGISENSTERTLLNISFEFKTYDAEEIVLSSHWSDEITLEPGERGRIKFVIDESEYKQLDSIRLSNLFMKVGPSHLYPTSETKGDRKAAPSPTKPPPTPTPTQTVLSIPSHDTDPSAISEFKEYGLEFVKEIHLDSRFYPLDITSPWDGCPSEEWTTEAENWLNEVNALIESEPNDSEIYLSRANGYFVFGKYTESLADLNKVIDISGSVQEIHEAKYTVHKCAGDSERADAELDTISQFQQDDLRGHLKRAYFFGSIGSYNKALNDVDAIIELDPEEEDWYEFSGHLLLALGRLGETISNDSQGIVVNEGDIFGTFSFHRAIPYLRRGQYELALTDLNNSIQATEDGISNFCYGCDEELAIRSFVRGVAYGMVGRFQESIVDLEKYIDEDPDYGLTYRLRAISLDAIGESDLSERDLAKACELDIRFC